VSTQIYLWKKEPAACRRFRTGVSLHSHTLHSREYLSIIPQCADRNRVLAWLVRREARRHGLRDIPREAISRAWWTPPLSPLEALHLESSQIENALHKRALVSITDHDNIGAAAELHSAGDLAEVLSSTEWTVPYCGSWFHIGVHNMPPRAAPALVESMNRYTGGGPDHLLSDLLHTIGQTPQALIVLNHPAWDSEAVGAELHRFALDRFLSRYGSSIHALEFNADRPWPENQATLERARALGIPVVAGGDRHGCHASPVVNLTDAGEFASFAEEVRSGRSVIALLPRLFESYRLRLLETAFDVLRDHPGHSRGWVRWSDRVFYTRHSGAATSLSEMWGHRLPGAVRSLVGLMNALGGQSVRPALRWALAEKPVAL